MESFTYLNGGVKIGWSGFVVDVVKSMDFINNYQNVNRGKGIW